MLCKSVKINKCPALAPMTTLDPAAPERIGIDLDACGRNREKLLADDGFIRRIARAYTGRVFGDKMETDMALYEGFIDNHDRPVCDRVLKSTPEELAEENFNFNDSRLPELLFRYRARNWPDSLSAEESRRWAEASLHRLQDSDDHPGRDLARYAESITKQRSATDVSEDALRVLDAMDAWGLECIDHFSS